MHIDHLTIILRVCAALSCGLLLGAEREYRGREAGLKTHASLSVACCLAMLVSAFGFSDTVTQGLIALDPSRIAAGVEGGIGFACAAVIWRSRSKVIGLTTAINIWASANIGLSCGAGLFFAGALITGCILFIHVVIGPLERKFFPQHAASTIVLTFNGATANLAQTLGVMAKKFGVSVAHWNITSTDGNQGATVEMELQKGSALSHLRFLDAVRTTDGVTTVSSNNFSE